MYNTPVLDFIQRKKDSALDALIVVLCSNQMYAEGICTALKSVADQVRYFTTAEAAKQNLRTQKPALWIVTDAFLCEKEQLWRKNKATPVILLSDSEGSGCRDDSDSKTIKLEMPVAPKALRETVIALVKQELKSSHGADAEQRKGEIRELANIIHLYASLSEEETQSPSLKEKQCIIQKTAEELLQIAEK